MQAVSLSSILARSISYLRFEAGALNTDALTGLTWTDGGTPASTPGKYGGGLILDGTNYLTSVDALGRAPFTNGWWMNAWIKNWSGPIFSSDAGSYENFIGANGSDLFMHMQSTTDSGRDGSAPLPIGFNPNVFNMVTFIAVSLSGSTHMKFYVNAIQIGDVVHAGVDPGLCEAGSKIGRYHVEGTNATGKIDDLLMGANDIITEEEIKKLYLDAGGAFLLNFVE